MTVAVMALFLVAVLRRPADAPLPVLGRITGFAFTNQAGQTVSSDDLLGHPWVADLIFTRCPGPCPEMTRNMATLQATLRAGRDGVRLVTLTADPEHDTPEVLGAFAGRFGADHSNWDFLTGDRGKINSVVLNQLLLSVAEKDPDLRETPEDLYLHSTKWVLVDGEGRLRAIYDGTDPASIGLVKKDLNRLEGPSQGGSK